MARHHIAEQRRDYRAWVMASCLSTSEEFRAHPETVFPTLATHATGASTEEDVDPKVAFARIATQLGAKRSNPK